MSLASVDELRDERRALRHLLDMRQMSAMREHLELGARDQVAIGRTVSRRDELVAVAPDDQRRLVDAVQPLAQVGIVKTRLPADLGERERVLHPALALFLVGHLLE